MTRRAAAVATTVLLATAACGGDDGTRVTLTGDDCAYDGPEAVEAGTVAIDLANETAGNGVFELVEIASTSSAEELGAYVAAEQHRLEAGDAVLGTPAFVTVVVQLEVAPGEVGVLTAGLTAGTYAIVCSSGAPPTAIHLAAPFEVA